MAPNKKRPSLKGLTSGTSALSRHVAPKGEAVHDEPAREAATAAAGAKMRYMQTRLSETGYRALKMLAAEQGKPLQGLVLEALNDMLRRFGKAPVVTGPEKSAKDEESK
jgi:hypothetical protein